MSGSSEDLQFMMETEESNAWDESVMLGVAPIRERHFR